jgi:hypothetical protein
MIFVNNVVATTRATLLVIIACSIGDGIASQAGALTLTEGSGEFLGSFRPAHPSSPAVEVDYINVLIDLTPRTSGFFDAGTGQTYDRSLNSPGWLTFSQPSGPVARTAVAYPIGISSIPTTAMLRRAIQFRNRRL